MRVRRHAPLSSLKAFLFLGGYFFCAKNIICNVHTVHDPYITLQYGVQFYTQPHPNPDSLPLPFLFLSIFQIFLFFFSVVHTWHSSGPRATVVALHFIIFILFSILLFLSLCALMLRTHHLTFFSLLVGPARDVTSSANIQQNLTEAAETLDPRRRHP